jgi:hypothetical protein
MTEYANKLSLIAERKQKLLEEESKLIEKRKQNIGVFAEKFGLLTASDALIMGLFAEVETAIKNKSDKIKEWENQGGRFLKSKRDGKTVEANMV